MTRQEAKSLGLRTYSGAACRKGHGTERWTCSGHCLVCKEQAKQRWLDKPENKESERQRFAANMADPVQKKRHIATVRRWQIKNKDRNEENRRRWIRDNLARVHAHNKVRQTVLRRGRAICSPEHQKEMLLFYQNCPKGYQVDHIYPLRGRKSCGLHVPWNLQYLTPLENAMKGNKEPEEVGHY